MDRVETTNYVAGTLERLRVEAVARRACDESVGSWQEREARGLVRMLALLDALRSQTVVP